MSYPGIAASTGTRVDSAAKHTMACRVNDALMAQWCSDQANARNQLHANKMKYSVHKDDLVLNVGMPLTLNSCIPHPIKAYPSVVSTLGDMTESTKTLIRYMYHAAKDGESFLTFKKTIEKMNKKAAIQSVVVNSEDAMRVSCEVQNIPYFQAQGYALGLAYASSLSGDTVSTVLIGGMATVRNGDFECRAGQMLQWYFDFEAEMFYKNNETHRTMTVLAGMRKAGTGDDLPTTTYDPRAITNIMSRNTHNVSASERQRKEYQERQQGVSDAFPIGGPGSVKRNVAYPKPYMLRHDGEEHYGDKIRVFCKCISGARPFEMMDIMVSCKSILYLLVHQTILLTCV